MDKKTITIVGGNGLMGQLFSKLWQSIGFNIEIIDTDNWHAAEELINKSDAIIISVPINITGDIIGKICQYIRTDCILADFTSIKSTPLIEMLKHHQGAVIGLHPMFGPTITTTNKQVVVVCEGRHPEQYQWLLDSILKLGFTLKHMTAEEHDSSMNFIQGIEHFLTFSLGTFLHHKNKHPDELIEVASPIYLAKLLLMGRIFDQDPKLYAEIIMADKSRLVLIKEFAEWLNVWVDKLTKLNKSEFINEFSSASKWMGEFTKYSQDISDKFLTIEIDKTHAK